MKIRLNKRFRKHAMSGKRWHALKERDMRGEIRTGKQAGDGMNRLLARQREEAARAEKEAAEKEKDEGQSGVGAS